MAAVTEAKKEVQQEKRFGLMRNSWRCLKMGTAMRLSMENW